MLLLLIMVLLDVLVLTEQSVVGAESRDSVIPFLNTLVFPSYELFFFKRFFWLLCLATAPFKVRFHPFNSHPNLPGKTQLQNINVRTSMLYLM